MKLGESSSGEDGVIGMEVMEGGLEKQVFQALGATVNSTTAGGKAPQAACSWRGVAVYPCTLIFPSKS